MNQGSTFSLDTGSSGSILYTLRRHLVETQNTEETEVIPSLPEGITFVKHLSAIADIVVKKSDTEHTL